MVTATTVNATTVNSSGADGAELMEWSDGNPDGEDRCGYFVALTGKKIRIAKADDDLRKVSVISGNYSFLGNDYVNFWHGKYKKDVYGRRITKKVVHPAVTDDEGNIISEEYTSTEYVLNDDYDENMEYIPRSERPEWDAVICYGQVVVRDDGTCVPDGFCRPNNEGIATPATDGFYVMDRVDESNILIYVR